MKRHPSLVPLSHDHQHALVQAKRLLDGGDPHGFLRFYLGDMLRHFREEEELLFPLLVEGDEAPELVVRALVQHQRIHAGAQALARGDGDPRALGELVEAHVRLEERELFPLVEARLADAEPVGTEPAVPSVELGGGDVEGAVRGLASADLNATLVAWGPGRGSPESVNAERDVLFMPLEGNATVEIDGVAHGLEAARALVVPKGARRRVIAGPLGVRYLTAHVRRDPTLRIGPAAPSS
jgi:mannose-6-phosphate isomerase-like protein (cupin superfamily)